MQTAVVQVCDMMSEVTEVFFNFSPFLIFQYSDRNVKFIHVGSSGLGIIKKGGGG